jgi:hypothetical protein
MLPPEAEIDRICNLGNRGTARLGGYFYAERWPTCLIVLVVEESYGLLRVRLVRVSLL